MKRMATILFLIAAWIVAVNGLCFAHGGQYRGPGESAPPNLGGPPAGSGGAGSSAGPTSGPTSPSVASPGSSSGSSRVARGGAGGLQRKRYSAGQGFERWEFWWEYNKDSFLNLRNQLYADNRIRGTASFLVGKSRKGVFRSSNRVTPEIVRMAIVPSLLAALDIDHPDVLDSSVLAVARVTGPDEVGEAMKIICAQLASKYQTAQQAACLSLGVLGSPEAISVCRDLMFDTPAGRKLVARSEVPRLVRAFAALSCGLIGSDAAVDDLRRIVESENGACRKDLVSCAITSLGLLGGTAEGDNIVRFLIERLDRPGIDPCIMAFVPIALGRLGDARAVTPLVRLLKDGKRENCVRRSAVVALGLLADVTDVKVVELLKGSIRGGRDVQTRHLAFVALARIAARDGNRTANEKEQSEIMKCFLGEIERPGRPSHLAWACLAAAIDTMADGKAQRGLAERIARRFKESKNPSDRSAMALCLGLLNADTSAGMLFETLEESRDKALQGYLCVSLGLMSWKKASERVREFVTEERVGFLQLQASVALGLMGDPEAVGILVKVLEEGRTLSIVSSAARALGQIGDSRAIGPLRGILADPKAGNMTKAFAVVALGLIGERTDLPWNAQISENANYWTRLEAMNEALNIL
jgi:HEAT repeat protein